MTINDFLPTGYEAPKTGSKNYMKLNNGENRIRILSKPILGWLDWDNNKPLRFRMNEKPSKPVVAARPIKHFWAFVVWDYADNKLKILEITQATIQLAIGSLTRDEDWGNPFTYDIKIIRSGEKMETNYQVSPVPHKQVAKEVQAALVQTTINLDALFSGGDPFEGNKPQVDDLPFN